MQWIHCTLPLACNKNTIHQIGNILVTIWLYHIIALNMTSLSILERHWNSNFNMTGMKCVVLLSPPHVYLQPWVWGSTVIRLYQLHIQLRLWVVYSWIRSERVLAFLGVAGRPWGKWFSRISFWLQCFTCCHLFSSFYGKCHTAKYTARYPYNTPEHRRNAFLALNLAQG